ncbi:hypothetical protein BU26DRAFT_189234 [Trematosphaeria pertusa]|uniref:Uncharacterized protein n=1 Tax=Trematosphaeria pertusa TaxID=390896 RepID=A0A6A6HRH4_9PLEO|nr:uncharacterized protein BU26DRAFT_189234 [Trematosphaeria pertusa]KAF2240755.1 hypothetical protein BU26DRAFT_189234 [Trematosphaeria pertusa]
MSHAASFVPVLFFLLPLVQAASFLEFLDFTSPSPLIFHSLATLLQVQPQTLFPNGHTIASVTVPRHTLLYHGRHDNDPVPSPEWLAFDMEMAYGIMGNMPDSRLLTYKTTRNVRAVYFDGTSASLMGDGTFSQMVFLYNGTDDVPKRGGRGPPPGRGHRDHGHPKEPENENTSPRPPLRLSFPRWNPLQDEYFRARELCKWLESSGLGGQGWGYEGIVRMNAGFELIWCDFDSPSLKLVSNLNVSAPRNYDPTAALERAKARWLRILELEEPLSSEDQAKLNQVLGIQEPIRTNPQLTLGPSEDEGPHGPGMTDPREPFRNTSSWFWSTAAAKRYHGDSRMRVDPRGIFSFYEPGLRNQFRSRIEDDISRLNLETNGRWRRGGNGENSFSSYAERIARRSDELRALMERRRQHRLTSVAGKDGVYMRAAVEKRLKNTLAASRNGDDVDWHYTAEEIITRYHNELTTLLDYLEMAPKPHETHLPLDAWIYQVRQVTHWFMLPSLEYPPDRPYTQERLQEIFNLDSRLAQTTLERCITQYDLDEQPVGDEDSILGNAIKETLHGICSTVIRIGLGVEYYWLMYFNPAPELGSSRFLAVSQELKYAAELWEQDMQELLAWLGWAEQWSRCEKQCDVGEMCYMPMWPVAGWGRGRWGEDPEFLWQPVCVDMMDYPPENSGSM